MCTPFSMNGIRGGVFRVPFVEWLGFHVLMHDPPSPFLEVCFSVSFLWLGSWIRLTGVFFRRKTYFYVFWFRFCGWVGVFFTVGWFVVYLVWVGAWVLCWCLASWLMVHNVWCARAAEDFTQLENTVSFTIERHPGLFGRSSRGREIGLSAFLKEKTRYSVNLCTGDIE